MKSLLPRNLPSPEDLLEELTDYEVVMEGLADDGSPSVYDHTNSTRELSATIGDVLYKIQDLEASAMMVPSAMIASSTSVNLTIKLSVQLLKSPSMANSSKLA
jgi:hypothetical protein